MIRTGTRLATALLLSSVLCAAARAGTVVTLQISGGDAPRTQTLYLDPGKVRQDIANHEMIFRADRQVIWQISPQQHEYHEMTKDSMAAVKAQQEAMLQRLPEEQRKRIQAMMNQHQGPAQPATYQPAGAPRKVGDWSCTPYTRTSGDEPKADICVARLSDLGLSRSDIEPLREMSDFIRTAMNLPGGQMPDFDEMSKAIGFDGMPIQTTSAPIPNQPATTTTLVKLERKSLAPDLFDLPPGLTKQEMPGLGGPGSPPPH